MRVKRLQAWLSSEEPSAAGLGRVPRHTLTFRRFGTFSELLHAAGLAHRAPAPARPTRSYGPSARKTLLVELRAWAEREPDGLFQCDFVRHWAQLDLSSHDELAGVRPCPDALRAILGTWDTALAAAELSQRGARSRPGGLLPTRPVLPRPAPRVEGDNFTVLGAWVRLAAEEDGFGASMSYPQYDQWRKRRLEAAARDGRPLEAIPSSGKLKDAAGGSWYTVKVLAHVPGAEQFAAERRHRRGYARDTVVDAVAAAVFDLTDLLASPALLGVSQYVRWRSAALARQRAARQAVRFPDVDVVRRTLGGPDRSWEVAIRTVLDERPSLLAPKPGLTVTRAGR